MLKVHASNRVCAAFIGALMISAAGSSSAGVITATYTGFIANTPAIGGFYGQVGVDYFGLFSNPGANLVGDPFSVTYTTDESTPGATPFFALNDYSYILSATTAILSINGNSFVLNAPVSFRISFADSPQYGGWGSYDFATNTDSNYQYGVKSELISGTDPFAPSYLYNVPFSHVAQSDDSSVDSLFYVYGNTAGYYLEDLPLSITDLTVTVQGMVIQPPPPPPPPPTVPEPSTWAMMLLGFAGLGYVGYRTSRKAISVAV
jgi:hypothetical protein